MSQKPKPKTINSIFPSQTPSRSGTPGSRFGIDMKGKTFVHQPTEIKKNNDNANSSSINTRFDFFNNFNQVPKSVLDKILPLTIGIKSDQTEEENKNKHQT